MPVVGEDDVRAVVREGRRLLVVGPNDLVTPAALETAEHLGVELIHGPLESSSPVGTDPGRAIRRTLYRRSPKWVSSAPLRGVTPTRFTRLAFVGAGAVGATTAHLAAIDNIADELLLVDIVPDIAASVALDIEHASGITGSPTRARGGTSLSLVAGSEAVVVTAGRPRTPGMTRSALTQVNRSVVRQIGQALAEHAPEAAVIVVTNPVDEMTYELWDASGLPTRSVIGMAGTLDSSRFRNALAEAAGVVPRDVEAVTLGSHGAEMIPVVSSATIKGRPVRDVLDSAEIERCVQDTIDGGAAVVALRRTGSASLAPAHAVMEILDAMRGARAGTVPVSAYLYGEYGIDDVFLGVPARMGRRGVTAVEEVALDAEEHQALQRAASAIRARLSGG